MRRDLNPARVYYTFCSGNFRVIFSRVFLEDCVNSNFVKRLYGFKAKLTDVLFSAGYFYGDRSIPIRFGCRDSLLYSFKSETLWQCFLNFFGYPQGSKRSPYRRTILFLSLKLTEYF